MEKEEANLQAPPASSSTAHESSRPDDLLRHVKAALKRHRPLGNMPSTNIKPRRVLLPQREPQRISSCNSDQEVDFGTSRDAASKVESSMQGCVEQRKNVTVSAEIADRSSITPPSTTEAYIGNANPASVQKVENKSVFDCKSDDVTLSSHVVRQPISSGDCRKKVQFSLGENVFSQQLEYEAGNSIEMPDINDHDMKQRDPHHMEANDINLRSDGGISSLFAKRSMLLQNPFFGKGISNPMNQASVVGSSSMTTVSVHSKSLPALNSTTYSSRPCQEDNSHMDFESPEEPNVNPQHMPQGYPAQLSYPQYHCTSGMVSDPVTAPTQMSISSQVMTVGAKDHFPSKEQEGFGSKESDRLIKGQIDHARGSSTLEDKPIKEKGHHPADVTDIQSQAPMTKSTCTSVKADPSKSDHPEKAASSKGASGPRKKHYDPDVFVKVNGKHYQKLGKIGSGGSSEVYKVISSDCTIYALKRIKLKGRDYSTAFGFCQEIEYLNKLKGKNNIIQLIDYEVTDKTLHEEVMNGDMNIKDGKIRDDGYIYMVLEYGEIDLAHMLSQKWREQDSSSWRIDENWLRFFWQQILQAVNTIHEERIVHSDLKPANFLLVKGSLKLIDFGIAKAIMSDTTNIQRDSQVGTLSYMSPEAFMCNESDSEGNAIKCGRPSDIWSLGCILYQMVYGRTPFAEYKTFWQKFKVITDRNHKIEYGPVSNPWLLDLMKKCLAWERKDRWRIPQLLQHPFLVPPVTPPSPQMNQGADLFQLIAETYGDDDDDVFKLCSQLQLLLKRSVDTKTPFPTLRDQHCVSLAKISTLCSQLQQHLASIER